MCANLNCPDQIVRQKPPFNNREEKEHDLKFCLHLWDCQVFCFCGAWKKLLVTLVLCANFLMSGLVSNVKGKHYAVLTWYLTPSLVLYMSHCFVSRGLVMFPPQSHTAFTLLRWKEHCLNRKGTRFLSSIPANPFAYRWVPLDPNVDNTNSWLIPSPTEITFFLSWANLPAWSEIHWNKKRIFPRCFFFELSGRHLYVNA